MAQLAQLLSPDYVSLNDIIQMIGSTGRANVRLAFVFTGGGARGVYEAGVAEALLQMGLKPDILIGTSAGAIVSTSMFIDLMYPLNDPNSIYKGGQSSIWRSIGNGNNGAASLVDKAWLIDLISGKPSPLTNSLHELSIVANKIARFFENEIPTLRNDWSSFMNAFHDAPSLQKSISDLNNAITQVKQDLSNIGIDADPSTTKRHFSQLADDVPKLFRDLSVEGKDFWDVLISILDEIGSILDAFGKLVADVATDVAVDVATLVMVIDTGLLLVGYLVPILAMIGLGGLGGLIAGSVADHIIENDGLKTQLRNFMTAAFQRYNTIPGGATWNSSIIADWNGRLAKGQSPPELIVTTSDVTAQRQLLFAIASEGTLGALAGDDRWVVDLTRNPNLVKVDNVFQSQDSDTSRETLLDACITSTSIPAAFKPQLWNLNGQVDGQPVMQPDGHMGLSHTCVDGGAIDNTPLDVASLAGATHILCIQLSSFFDKKTKSDNGYSIIGLISALSDIMMNGSLRDTIDTVIADNAKSANPVQIFRLAPAEDPDPTNPISIQTFDFDGHYDKNLILTMNIYDFFIQGYVDAMGFADVGYALKDKVFSDYQQKGLGLGCQRMTKVMYGGKKFWWARNSPEPALPPNTP